MSEINKVFSLYKYQIMWHKKSMGLWVVLVLVLSLAVGIIIDPYLFNIHAHVSVIDVAKGFSSLSAFVILLVALFLAADAVSREFQSKTAYFILPTPVKRSTILSAKFLGTYLVSAVLLLIYFVVGIGYMAIAYHTVPARFFASMALSFLYLASMLAFTYMFSAIFDSGAVVATLVFILAVFGEVIILIFENVLHFEPWFWIWYGASVVTLVYAGNYIGDYPHIASGPMGTLYNPYIWEGVLIMVGYLVISFLVAAWVFERKEVK